MKAARPDEATYAISDDARSTVGTWISCETDGRAPLEGVCIGVCRTGTTIHLGDESYHGIRFLIADRATGRNKWTPTFPDPTSQVNRGGSDGR